MAHWITDDMGQTVDAARMVADGLKSQGRILEASAVTALVEFSRTVLNERVMRQHNAEAGLDDGHKPAEPVDAAKPVEPVATATTAEPGDVWLMNHVVAGCPVEIRVLRDGKELAVIRRATGEAGRRLIGPEESFPHHVELTKAPGIRRAVTLKDAIAMVVEDTCNHPSPNNIRAPGCTGWVCVDPMWIGLSDERFVWIYFQDGNQRLRISANQRVTTRATIWDVVESNYASRGSFIEQDKRTAIAKALSWVNEALQLEEALARVNESTAIR